MERRPVAGSARSRVRIAVEESGRSGQSDGLNSIWRSRRAASRKRPHARAAAERYSARRSRIAILRLSQATSWRARTRLRVRLSYRQVREPRATEPELAGWPAN